MYKRRKVEVIFFLPVATTDGRFFIEIQYTYGRVLFLARFGTKLLRRGIVLHLPLVTGYTRLFAWS
jgi:hypothetical protein